MLQEPFISLYFISHSMSGEHKLTTTAIHIQCELKTAYSRVSENLLQRLRILNQKNFHVHCTFISILCILYIIKSKHYCRLVVILLLL